MRGDQKEGTLTSSCKRKGEKAQIPEVPAAVVFAAMLGKNVNQAQEKVCGTSEEQK